MHKEVISNHICSAGASMEARGKKGARDIGHVLHPAEMVERQGSLYSEGTRHWRCLSYDHGVASVSAKKYQGVCSGEFYCGFC